MKQLTWFLRLLVNYKLPYMYGAIAALAIIVGSVFHLDWMMYVVYVAVLVGVGLILLYVIKAIIDKFK